MFGNANLLKSTLTLKQQKFGVQNIHWPVKSSGKYLLFLFQHTYTHCLSHHLTHFHAQIVGMERLILKALDFNLTAPTTYTFLLRFLKAAEAEQLQTTSPMESVDLLIQTIEALAKVGDHAHQC